MSNIRRAAKDLAIYSCVVLLMLSILPLYSGTSSALPSGWTGDVISNDLCYSAAAMDSLGHMHILYYLPPYTGSGTLGEVTVYYINDSSGSWSSPVAVRTVQSREFPIGLAMALDQDSHVHASVSDYNPYGAYNQEYDILYLNNVAGTWSSEMAVQGIGSSEFSFCLDAEGKVNLAYFTSTGNDLGHSRADVRYATNRENTWSYEIIDTLQTWDSDYIHYLLSAGSTSIAVDSYGFCHVSYDYRQMAVLGDWSDPDAIVIYETQYWTYVNLVSQTYGGWSSSINLDSFQSMVGGSVDLAVDSNDTLHLVYVRSYYLDNTSEFFSGSGTIQYVNSSDWIWFSDTVVLQDCISWATPTLVLNATGTPFISFLGVTGVFVDDPGEMHISSMSAEVLVWTGEYWGVLGEFSNSFSYPYIVVDPQGTRLSLIYDQLDSIINPTSVEFSYATTIVAVLPEAPGAPTDFTAYLYFDQVTLTWTVPSDDGGSPIIGYQIFRGLSEDSMELIAELDAYTFEYTDTALTLDTTYYYKVAAVSSAGTGAFSIVIPVTPTIPVIPTVPGVPTNVSASAGNGNITLTWSPPLSDGGSPVTGYIIYRGADDETLLLWRNVPADPSSFLDTLVEKGVEYRYAISAVNVIGSGMMSSNVSAVPYGTPSAPRDLQLDQGDGVISVSWSPPEYLGPGSVTYVLYRDGEVVYSGAETEFDDDVDEGIAYSYRVAAVNDLGRGSNSSEGSMMLSPEPNDDGALMIGLASLAVGGAVAVTFVMLRKRK